MATTATEVPLNPTQWTLVQMILAGALAGFTVGLVRDFGTIINGASGEVARALGAAFAYAVLGAFAGGGVWYALHSGRRP